MSISLDFVYCLEQGEEDKVEQAVPENYKALGKLSIPGALKVLTSNLDRVKLLIKDRSLTAVKEDNYALALHWLSILEYTTKLFEASAAWQEEVYAKLLIESKEEMLEEKKSNSPEVEASSTLPNADDTQYSSSSSEVEAKQELRENEMDPPEENNTNVESTKEYFLTIHRQQRWAILEATSMLKNYDYQRDLILVGAVGLMRKRGWLLATDRDLWDMLDNCVDKYYIYPKKTRLSDYGERELERLSAIFKDSPYIAGVDPKSEKESLSNVNFYNRVT